MGFADGNENRQALTKFGNDIHQAMDELVRRQEQREQSAHLHPQVLLQLNLKVIPVTCVTLKNGMLFPWPIFYY